MSVALNNTFGALFTPDSDDEGDSSAPSRPTAAKAAPKRQPRKAKPEAGRGGPRAPAGGGAAVNAGVPVSKDVRAHDRAAKSGDSGSRPVRPGKREMERVSGTGRGREVSKGGHGGRNWGNAGDDIALAKKAAGAKDAADVAEHVGEGGEAPAAAVQEEEEPEAHTMTLEEYQKEVLASKRTGEAFQAAEPRAVSTAEFKGAVNVSKKNVPDTVLIGGGGVKARRERNRPKKEAVDPNLFFTTKPRRVDGGDRPRGGGERGGFGGRGGRGGRSEGGERGGRGGSRGGRTDGERGGRGGRGGFGGRGGSRGGPSGRGSFGGRGGGRGGSAPRVHDESAFPRLG